MKRLQGVQREYVLRWFKGVSRVFLGSFKGVSRVFPKVFYGSFKKIFKVFQRSFMLHGTHQSYPSRRRACSVSDILPNQGWSIARAP